MWVGIALGIGWAVALIMGLALIALANQIGNQYVYTADGISRTGPPIHTRIRLSDLISGDNLAVLEQAFAKFPFSILLLVHGGSLSGFPHLMSSARQFGRYEDAGVQLIVICVG